MKKTISILLIIHFGILVNAQDCFTTLYQKGTAEYNRGNYASAINKWVSARDNCYKLDKEQISILEYWIEKAELNRNNQLSKSKNIIEKDSIFHRDTIMLQGETEIHTKIETVKSVDNLFPKTQAKEEVTILKNDLLSNLKWNIKPTLEYDWVYFPNEGKLKVKKFDKYGFIDDTGKEIIALNYDAAWAFSEGMAKVKKSDKWGFINEKGEVIIPFIYNRAWSFSGGIAAVKKSDKWGFIDKTGKVVIPFIYQEAHSSSRYPTKSLEGDTIYRVREYKNGWANGAVFYIDKTGEIVKKVASSRLLKSPISNSNITLAVKSNKKSKKFGFKDKTGKIVIPIIYDKAVILSEEVVAVKKSDKWGLKDITGKKITRFIYDDIKIFSGGLTKVKLTKVKKSGKWGLIDKTGKEIISLIYDDILIFSNETAKVKKSGKWGLIDKTGKEIISLIYDDVSNFSNGLAKVKKSNKWGLVDITGKEITPIIFDGIGYISEDSILVKYEGKWGSVNFINNNKND